MRLIAVVMGEPDSKIRNKEITEMLDYAFAQYKVTTIFSKNQIIDSIEIEKTQKNKYDIMPISDINILHKKIDEINYTYDIKLNKVNAPLKKGDKVGEITISSKSSFKIDLIVSEDVKKANIIELYLKYLGKLLSFGSY